MLIGTIDLYYFILLSVPLTMVWGHSISRKQTSSSRSSDGNSSLPDKVAVHRRSLRLPYSLRATGVWSGQIPFLSG